MAMMTQDNQALLAALADLLTTETATTTPDYRIRKDCPLCRRFVKKGEVTHPGAVEILPQADGWWQLMHTSCLRRWVAASYGTEQVIDISGPMEEDAHGTR